MIINLDMINISAWLKRCVLMVSLLFCLLVNIQAQGVNGIISNGSVIVSGASVRNLHSSVQSFSDSRGMFSIPVKKGDMLLTTKSFYKTDTLIYNGQAFLKITLKEDKLTLHEVTIRATGISPQAVYEKNKSEYKDIYIKGDYSHMVGVAIGTMPGVSLNIDKLYNLLSKDGKDARRMQRTLTRDYHDDVVDRRFTKTLVRNIAGYDSSRLDAFMMKYRPTYDFIVKASDYDVETYVKEKLTLGAK